MIDFVICVCTGTDDADLQVRKVYEAIPDSSASSEGLLRVVDESVDDYLYPAEYFRPIDLPGELRALFARSS